MCHVIALQSLKSSRFIKMLSSLSRSLGRIFVSRCLAALAVTLDASPMGLSAVYWLYSVRMRRQWELAVWNFSATYYNIELMRHINSALTTVWLSPRHAVDIRLVSSLPGLGLVNSGVYITMGFVDTPRGACSRESQLHSKNGE